MDRHKGRLRERIPESFPCSGLSYFYGIFLPSFLWTIILTCRVHSSYLVYLRILPCVCIHLSAKILPNRHLGRTTFDITSLWPPKSLSVHLLSRGSPDFENKKSVVWAGPSSLALIALIALLFLSWGFYQQRMISNCFTLGGGPICLWPQLVRYLDLNWHVIGSVVMAWEDQRAELELPPAQLKDAFYSQSKDQESDILERTEQTSAAGFVDEQDPAGNRPLPKFSAFKYGGNCMLCTFTKLFYKCWASLWLRW